VNPIIPLLHHSITPPPAAHANDNWLTAWRAGLLESAPMPQPLTWSSGLVWNAPSAVWNGFAVPATPHTMTNDNKISAAIAAQAKTDILAAFATIRTNLPFLINLTPEEIRRMPTIGTARGGMSTTFQQEMAAHPDLVPSYVDMTEVEKDLVLLEDLDELASHARELCEAIEETRHAVGSDLYLAFLSFYNNVAQAAKRGVAGINAVYENLRRYFRRGGNTTPPAPPPNP
jgi:hypothetical protein